ncbi:MAG: M24 family metallopeptidase [Thermoanaerobaculia bacterium]
MVVVAESSRDPDLAPFVGPVHLGKAILVATGDRRPTLGYLTSMERGEAAVTGCTLFGPEQSGLTDLREKSGAEHRLWASLIEATLAFAGVSCSTVALAGRAPAGLVHAACSVLESKGWGFNDGSVVARTYRKLKGEDEIKQVRSTAAVVCSAFRRIAGLLAAASVRGDELWLEGERLKVARVRSEVAVLFAQAGLEQPMGNIFAVGAKAAIPHTQGESMDVLRPGKALVVDLFPRDTLFADCTRTFCVGELDRHLYAAHKHVYQALVHAQGKVQVGIRASRLQQAVCAEFEKAGYDTPQSRQDPRHGYVHNLGHGVGFELHEFPTFAETETEGGRLEAGDLFTIEPGLYEPSLRFGVRLEDLCYLSEDGLEILTDLPYDLDPNAWV